MIARRDSLISSTPRLIGGFDQLRFALQVINVDLELSRRLDVGDREQMALAGPKFLREFVLYGLQQSLGGPGVFQR